MSEETVVVTPAVPVVPAEPVVPVEPVVPELRYEYQPTDEKGRPLGGKQVILYRTPDELAAKLSEQNTQLVRKLREVTRKQKLGIGDDEVPQDAERFQSVVEFKEQTVTPDEAFQIAEDLKDPQKFAAARDRLLESATGAKASDLRKVLNQVQIDQLQLMARANFEQFRVVTSSGYQDSLENRETITAWMIKNRLAPTVSNFELAHSQLKEAGLLSETPIVREDAPLVENKETAAPSPAEPVSRIADPEPPQQRNARVPSGLNSRVASTTGRPADSVTITLSEIDNMSAEDYKRRLTDPAFVTLVNKLDTEAIARNRSR